MKRSNHHNYSYDYSEIETMQVSFQPDRKYDVWDRKFEGSPFDLE